MNGELMLWHQRQWAWQQQRRIRRRFLAYCRHQKITPEQGKQRLEITAVFLGMTTQQLFLKLARGW